MPATGEDHRAVSTRSWDTRLYWLWILYTRSARARSGRASGSATGTELFGTS
jgi:hypothetical protein